MVPVTFVGTGTLSQGIGVPGIKIQVVLTHSYLGDLDEYDDGPQSQTLDSVSVTIDAKP